MNKFRPISKDFLQQFSGRRRGGGAGRSKVGIMMVISAQPAAIRTTTIFKEAKWVGGGCMQGVAYSVCTQIGTKIVTLCYTIMTWIFSYFTLF